MSEPLRCADARELVPEVALGLAPAQDRGRLLAHIATCRDCQVFLAELSDVVDDVVAIAPPSEPPPGFESQVLARLSKERRRLGAVRRIVMRAAVILASVVVGAAVSGGAVYWAHEPDRALASKVRSTLATANGQYFTAFPVLDVADAQRGFLFGYQGQPAWLFVIVRGPLAPARYSIEITDLHGVRHVLATGIDLSQTLAWGGMIPVPVHEVSVFQIEDGGAVIFSARLTFR